MYQSLTNRSKGTKQFRTIERINASGKGVYSQRLGNTCIPSDWEEEGVPICLTKKLTGAILGVIKVPKSTPWEIEIRENPYCKGDLA
jgi:hypothetical protein